MANIIDNSTLVCDVKPNRIKNTGSIQQTDYAPVKDSELERSPKLDIMELHNEMLENNKNIRAQINEMLPDNKWSKFKIKYLPKFLCNEQEKQIKEDIKPLQKEIIKNISNDPLSLMMMFMTNIQRINKT